jgi:hypothetical protein
MLGAFWLHMLKQARVDFAPDHRLNGSAGNRDRPTRSRGHGSSSLRASSASGLALQSDGGLEGECLGIQAVARHQLRARPQLNGGSVVASDAVGVADA